MRILLVSMNSIHFRRWSEQLRDSGHDIYWFDILDQGYAPSMSWMTQITGWKKGFLKKRGRTFIKNKSPKLYTALVNKYDTKAEEAFAKALQESDPDLVHSFSLHIACLPILEVMIKNDNLKWMYSSWGSDLFYQKNKPNYHQEVSAVLSRVNFLITDCKRDAHIAIKMRFKGDHVGIFPGGGGFESQDVSLNRRKNTFVLKGYESEIGKAIPILKALHEISKNHDIKVSIFGATDTLVNFLHAYDLSSLRLEYFQEVSNDKVLELMSASTFYIGNSISDGMPNTMLEAIFSGCIPIQSNPGNATAEIINHSINGYLINEPENTTLIKYVLLEALNNSQTIEDYYNINESIRTRFGRELVKNEVLKMYNSVK
jgi:hypothetical protein